MKTEILDKIESLFFEDAFMDVSMDDVAKNLNMKKASLYYHFASKEQMFIDILNYSFGKYIKYLNKTFLCDDINLIISWLVSFPIESKNLFSVVSQKWYCKIWIVRDLIVEKNKELLNVFHTYFKEKHNFTNEKTIIFQWIINDLSKKYCIFDCKETLDINKLIPEIQKTFF